MKKKSSLKEILEDLIKICDFSRNNRQEIKLSGGLKISCVRIEDDYHLELTRINNKPSMVEWGVVLDNMPFFNYVPPTIQKIKGQLYFIGILKKEGLQAVRGSQPIENPRKLYHV